MDWIISVLVAFLSLIWAAAMIMSPMMIAAEGFAKSNQNLLLAIILLHYPALLFLLMYWADLHFFTTAPLTWALSVLVIGGLVALLLRLPQHLLRNFRRRH